MPLVSKESFGATTTLWLWRIAEGIDDLCAVLTTDDMAHLESVSSDLRCREKAAWRSVVRRYITNSPISYNSLGAPILACGGSLSVSHSGDMVAVLFSTNGVCGVDIEQCKRNFERVQSRYIADCERDLVGNASDPLFLATVWCAKEAMYKMAGRDGVDLRDGLRITTCNLSAQLLIGHLPDGRIVELHQRLLDGYVVVFGAAQNIPNGPETH